MSKAVNSNILWETPTEIAEAIMCDYSVTDPETILKQYLAQVTQYPLYQDWFDRIMLILQSMDPIIHIAEYGSGPGLLAKRIHNLGNGHRYTAIEPSAIFRQMTLTQNPDTELVPQTAEIYAAHKSFDVVVATATYHHFVDKPTAIQQIHANLKQGGILIIADTFLPTYQFDAFYNPIDKAEFLTAVMRYVAAQIMAMPNPTAADIEDQVRTAFLDILRIEELKACVPILKLQLEAAGFSDISIELMKGTDESIDYKTLGWHFVTAHKPK